VTCVTSARRTPAYGDLEAPPLIPVGDGVSTITGRNVSLPVLPTLRGSRVPYRRDGRYALHASPLEANEDAFYVSEYANYVTNAWRAGG